MNANLEQVLAKARERASDAERSERANRAREAQNALNSTIPAGLFDGRTHQDALAALCPDLASVVGWDWGDGPIVIVGASGRGKTTACALLVRRLLGVWVASAAPLASKALRVSWWRSRALAREVQSTRLGNTCPALETALRSPLLVLDDLGWEPDPAMVGDLLCERTDHGRPTIVTSGQPLEAIELRYGQPVVRRCIQRGRLVEAW